VSKAEGVGGVEGGKNSNLQPTVYSVQPTASPGTNRFTIEHDNVMGLPTTNKPTNYMVCMSQFI
jgi:hypothetical protein